MRAGPLVAATALVLALVGCGGDEATTSVTPTPPPAASAPSTPAPDEPAPDEPASDDPNPDDPASAAGSDEAAVAAAVAEHRATPRACDGMAEEVVEGQPDHHLVVLDGLTVVAVFCEAYAYQSLWELHAWDGEALLPLEVEQWQGGLAESPMVLGYPLDDADGVLVNLEKGRGVGDCGLWQEWFVADEDRLGLAVARERACDDESPYVEPDQWPIVYPAGP